MIICLETHTSYDARLAINELTKRLLLLLLQNKGSLLLQDLLFIVNVKKIGISHFLLEAKIKNSCHEAISNHTYASGG